MLHTACHQDSPFEVLNMKLKHQVERPIDLWQNFPYFSFFLVDMLHNCTVHIDTSVADIRIVIKNILHKYYNMILKICQ